MNNKNVPARALIVDGVEYVYEYSMVPSGDFPALYPLRDYPLHLYWSDTFPVLPSHDFPVVILGGNNDKVYTFSSFFDFQRSPIVAFTAHWTEMLLVR
jgi:hypothetical protein